MTCPNFGGGPNNTGIVNVQGEEQGLVFLPPDEGGLVGIVSIPVPLSDGEGSPVNVSSYVGRKTFELSGNYQGRITILGSHDGILYAPLLLFDAGQFGQQQMQKTIPFVTRFIKVRRRADSIDGSVITLTMAAQLTCPCP
jgi:hypothetical protein